MAWELSASIADAAITRCYPPAGLRAAIGRRPFGPTWPRYSEAVICGNSNHSSWHRAPSIVPEVLKPLWGEFRVPDRMLNVALPQIMLDSACIQVFVRQVKAASMPQHMWMDGKG
jgi:hypothetical protein